MMKNHESYREPALPLPPLIIWALSMELGDHRLDMHAQVLRNRDGAVVSLRPQAWSVLCLLETLVAW